MLTTLFKFSAAGIRTRRMARLLSGRWRTGSPCRVWTGSPAVLRRLRASFWLAAITSGVY